MSFGIGTLLVAGQSSLENRAREDVVYPVAYGTGALLFNRDSGRRLAALPDTAMIAVFVQPG